MIKKSNELKNSTKKEMDCRDKNKSAKTLLIVAGGVTVAALCVGIGFYIGKNNSKSLIANLKLENAYLKHRIKDLVARCAEKDMFFNIAISRLLKYGDSFGAQQMSYKKSYLKHQNTVA